MENELDSILKQNEASISKIILSKTECELVKIVIHPILVKNQEMWQMESFKGTQVFQNNIDYYSMCEFLKENFVSKFKQINIFTTQNEIIGLASKKGKITFVTNSKTKIEKNVVAQNKVKQYILNEGMDIPVLRDLSVFTQDNKIVQSKYDKFKQINRFVEILDDAFANYKKDEITILDFGCGKSYLTFVVYYYFTEIKKIKAKVIGYDLKSDVVDFCNQLAKKYDYRDLQFFVNDITKDNVYNGNVDMMITLHACDTATDFALKYAITNQVPFIFSVPCCQHEINAQITKGGDMDILLEYGLIKERFSALLTDSIRATILKDFGYKVDILEFVDFSHSPKNLMLRCKLIKSQKPIKNKMLIDLQKQYNFKQTLYNELYK